MQKVTRAPQRAYQICTRCVMDTSDPWIRFDAEGRCNHCSEFLDRRLAITAYGQTNVDRLEPMLSGLRASRSSKASHDVVVGVSGGVDSSLVAFLAQHGLAGVGCSYG